MEEKNASPINFYGDINLNNNKIQNADTSNLKTEILPSFVASCYQYVFENATGGSMAFDYYKMPNHLVAQVWKGTASTGYELVQANIKILNNKTIVFTLSEAMTGKLIVIGYKEL